MTINPPYGISEIGKVPVCPVCFMTMAITHKDNCLVIECGCDDSLPPELKRDDAFFSVWHLSVGGVKWKFRWGKETDLLESFYEEDDVWR